VRSDFRAVVREVERLGGTKTSARVRWRVGVLARREAARAWPMKPPAPVMRICWVEVGWEPILVFCPQEMMGGWVGWRSLRRIVEI
jgi:hypothetical protein